MRVVLIASAPPAAARLSELLTEMGHEIAALVAIRAPAGRYGPDYPSALLRLTPSADLLFVRSGKQLTSLLAEYMPDVAVCASFPARVPDAALSVPRLGIINGHPGSLPRYRGPNPLGWALRNGDSTLGMSFQRMTSKIDAGPILAQGTFAIADDEEPLSALLSTDIWGALLAQALSRAAAGDPGDAQDETQAGYAGVFEPAYLEVDRTQSARQIHNQTRAWQLAPPVDGVRGPFTTLHGRRVRLVRTSMHPRAGAEPLECGDRALWVLETEPAMAPLLTGTQTGRGAYPVAGS